MKIKLPGFIQSFLDIPYALLGFPKNLFCAPKNFKELQKCKRAAGGYSWLAAGMIIASVLLYLTPEMEGTGMVLLVFGICFALFVGSKKRDYKSFDFGEKIEKLTCPDCKEMATFDENVTYEVLETSWHVDSHKTPSRAGSQGAASPHIVSASSTEHTDVKVTCKCQKCGKEHSFDESFITRKCSKRVRGVSPSTADLVRLQLEKEVRKVSTDVFDKGGSGENDLDVTVESYSMKDRVKEYFSL
ncbi:MAG: hypothetical protein IKU07_07965 [Oscillospiraceae bacterium]|nr:hypothetical protein [Oscillospiraceae bacterium]